MADAICLSFKRGGYDVISLNVPNNLLMKFPVILREKLINEEIVLQDEVGFEYNDICAYRCVTRKKNDNSEVTREDFRSKCRDGA